MKEAGNGYKTATINEYGLFVPYTGEDNKEEIKNNKERGEKVTDVISLKYEDFASSNEENVNDATKKKIEKFNVNIEKRLAELALEKAA